MANTTNFSSTSRVLQFSRSKSDLVNLTECGICGDLLAQPRALPCLHSYCRDCLSQLFAANNLSVGSYFNCPQCRHRCQVPIHGVLGFPINFFVENIKQQVIGVDLTQILTEASANVDKYETKALQDLANRKKALLDQIDLRHSYMLDMLSKCIEELKSRINDQNECDSNDVDNVTGGLRKRLQDLRDKVYAIDTQEEVCEQLKQHAETVRNVAIELEAIKSNCNLNLQRQLQFIPGYTTEKSLAHQFGTLQIAALSQSQKLPISENVSEHNLVKQRTCSQKCTHKIAAILICCCAPMVILTCFFIYEPLILTNLLSVVRDWFSQMEFQNVVNFWSNVHANANFNLPQVFVQWVTIENLDITFVTRFLIAFVLVLCGLIAFESFLHSKTTGSANVTISEVDSNDDKNVLGAREGCTQ